MKTTRVVTGYVPQFELRLVTGPDTSISFVLDDWLRALVRQHMAVVNQKRGLIDPRSRMGRAKRQRRGVAD